MENNKYEFWAFRHHPRVLRGEKIIFTFNGSPVAEAICDSIESPGKSKCTATGRYEDYWKVFWTSDSFKKYKTASSEEPEYLGNCTEDEVIEHLFGDATLFAQALEDKDNVWLDENTCQNDKYGVLIKHDPETDIHSFYKTAYLFKDYENEEYSDLFQVIVKDQKLKVDDDNGLWSAVLTRPAVLHHATRKKYLDSILKTGLEPRGRHHSIHGTEPKLFLGTEDTCHMYVDTDEEPATTLEVTVPAGTRIYDNSFEPDEIYIKNKIPPTMIKKADLIRIPVGQMEPSGNQTPEGRPLPPVSVHTDTMYHVSRVENRQGILAKGLVPQAKEFLYLKRESGVYLMGTLVDAEKWASRFGIHPPKPQAITSDIWEVHLPEGTEVVHDSEMGRRSGAWITYQTIPPENLHIIKTVTSTNRGSKKTTSSLHTKEEAKSLLIALQKKGIKAAVVGSVAREGQSEHDIDLLLTSTTPKESIITAFREMGWGFFGNSTVSPEEAAESQDGKTYHQGWSEILHFQLGDERQSGDYFTRKNVDFWIPDSLQKLSKLINASTKRFAIGKVAAEYENAYQQDRNEYSGKWDENETEEQGRARYRRKNEWDQSLLAAISLGKFDPKRADERGDYTLGVSSKMIEAFKPLPQVLYHVTTAKSKVQSGNLQSRFELSMQNGLGLGGGDDKSISFTEDLDVAKGIYSAMIEAKRVAAGEFTVQQMLDLATKGDGADRPWITEFIRWAGAYRAHNEWNPGEPYPDNMQAILNGKKLVCNNMFDFHTKEDLESQGFEPVGRPHQGRDALMWSRWLRPMTEKEKQDIEFDQYKVFCYAREHAGGALNPLFFSTDVEGLAKVPESEIAILKFKPIPGAMGTQESALGEWRTYSGQAVQLVGDVRNKTASGTISGEEVLQYLMKLNKWSKETALEVLGIDGYGSDYTLEDYPLNRLQPGDDWSPELSKEYAARSTPFPPIILGYDWNWLSIPGRKRRKLVIRDGNHRVDAAKMRKDKTIKAYVPMLSTYNPTDSREPGYHKFATQPMVMYHGTNEPFTKVDMGKGAQGIFWLTSDLNSLQKGERGACSTKVILRCLVTIKNPAGWNEYEKYGIGELKGLGYDGVILPDSNGSFDAVVFKSSQVKIVGQEKTASDPRNLTGTMRSQTGINTEGWVLPNGTFFPLSRENGYTHIQILSNMGYGDYTRAYREGFIRVSSESYFDELQLESTKPLEQIEKLLLKLSARIPEKFSLHIVAGEGGGFAWYFWDRKLNQFKMEKRSSSSFKNRLLNKAAAKYRTYTPDTRTFSDKFMTWFNGSKVVDLNGKPLIVWHGSPDMRWLKEHGVFQTPTEALLHKEDPRRAFFFAADRSTAVSYADDHRAWDYQGSEPGTRGFYLCLKNPMVVNNQGKKWHGTNTMVDDAYASGHDGVTIHNTIDSYQIEDGRKVTDVYIAFHPEQIKAVEGNSGDYNPTNKSVYGSVANPLLKHAASDEVERAEALKYQDENAYLRHHYTGPVPSSAYSDEGMFNWQKLEKYPILLKTTTLNDGRVVELRQEGSKTSYVKTNAEGEIIRDSQGMAQHLTDEEIKEKGYPTQDTAIMAFNKEGQCVAQASDEWGADLVAVREDYQKAGLGTIMLTEFRRQFSKVRQMGQMTPAGTNLTKSYYRSLTGKEPQPVVDLDEDPDYIARRTIWRFLGNLAWADFEKFTPEQSEKIKEFERASEKSKDPQGLLKQVQAWVKTQPAGTFSQHAENALSKTATVIPSDLVYHNTTSVNLESIKRDGLEAGSFSSRPIDFGGNVWLAVSKADLPEPSEHQYGDVTAYEPRYEYTEYGEDENGLSTDESTLARHIIPADKLYLVTRRGRVISKLAATPVNQIMQWADAWKDQFRPGEPGYVPVESLDWKEERNFDLHKIVGWDAGGYDELHEDQKEERIPEDEEPGTYEYFNGMCEAIKNGTIEEIYVAQGTDGKFYVWEGNHRVGMAHVLGVTTMPAFVGYQRPKKTASELHEFPSFEKLKQSYGMYFRYDINYEKEYNALATMYNNMGDPLTLYRLIKLRDGVANVKEEGVGVYWTWDEDVAENFLSYTEDNYVFKAEVPAQCIDWGLTLAHNMHPAYKEEHEVRLESHARFQIIGYRQQGSTKWFQTEKSVTATTQTALCDWLQPTTKTVSSRALVSTLSANGQPISAILRNKWGVGILRADKPIPVFYLKTDSLTVNSLDKERGETHAKALAEEMRAGKQFAPIVMADFGMIVDGYHRLRAAQIIGLEQVPCTRLSDFTKQWGGKTAATKYPEFTTSNYVLSMITEIHQQIEFDEEFPDRLDSEYYQLKDISITALAVKNNLYEDKEYAGLTTAAPPIVLNRKGEILDGFHRIGAALTRGEASIKAYVPCSKELAEDHINKAPVCSTCGGKGIIYNGIIGKRCKDCGGVGKSAAVKTAAPRSIWYHGSPFKNLRSILAQGLIPDVKNREWQDDPNAGINNPSRESYGGCYDDKTRILTRTRGFQHFTSLLPDDEVATLVGKELVWEKPIASTRYWYEGPMYAFKTKVLDQLITPDHKVYWRNRITNEARLRRGDSETEFKLSAVSSLLGESHEVTDKLGRKRICAQKTWGGIEFKRNLEWHCAPASVMFEPPPTPTRYMEAYGAYKDWKGLDKDFCALYGVTGNSTLRWKMGQSDPWGKYVSQPQEFKFEDWLELLGWYLSEGSLDKKGRICISQQKLDYREEICQLLTRMSIAFNTTKHSIRFSHHPLHAYLSKFGLAPDKFIPQEVKELAPDKLEIILGSLMKGDGSKKRRGESGIYLSSSQRLAEDVAEIALKCGYGVSMGVRPPTKGRKIDSKLTSYYVCLSKWNSYSLCGVPTIIPDFKGWVSCVQVSSGVIFVERNGKTCWSGNSYVTTNVSTAVGAPRDTGYYGPGRMVLVAMELQPNTMYLDEDNINLTNLSNSCPHLSDPSYHAPGYYIALTQPNVPQNWKEGIKEIKQRYINECMSYWTYKFTMHPELKKRFRELLPSTWEAALTRQTAHAVAKMKDYDVKRAYREVFNVDWDTIPPKEQLFPTIAQGEAAWRKASEQLTRTLRLQARPNPNEFHDTARIEAPIGYHGSNHILAVAEIREGHQWRGNDGKDPVKIIMHYGQLPEDFFKQWKERKGYELKIVKAEEAGQEKTSSLMEPIPPVVYHGTENKFEEFQPGHSNGWSVSRTGYYFTDDFDIAKEFGSQVIEAKITMNHPLDLRDNYAKDTQAEFEQVFALLPQHDKEQIENGPYKSDDPRWIISSRITSAVNGGYAQTAAFISAAEKLGYDGLIMKDRLGGGPSFWSFIVFKPSQIKTLKSSRPG